ncbi:MAG TPA: permease-like cell division protein FtsX [Flavobacterium sp.]|nr:permease-like cell division protein FtsX [Flavobacterium sp.]
MSKSYERFQKRRLISSYFSVVLSIFLVLFLLGSLGMFVINAEKISNTFKENIPMTIFFKDEVKETDLTNTEAEIRQQAYLKDLKFVHKDSAAVEHQQTIGENFVHFLGYNPLQHSFDIHLNGVYVQKDSIKNIELSFKENPLVDDVIYDQELVTLVNENIEKVTFWVLVVSAAFALISMLLINSSLRLSVYSNRFIIKTMQMVGATKSFIRRPFVWRSIKLGLIGAVLAIIGVLALTSYVDKQLPTLGLMKDYQSIAIVSVGILVVGIIITWISTYFATQRFLNLNSDDLY